MRHAHLSPNFFQNLLLPGFIISHGYLCLRAFRKDVQTPTFHVFYTSDEIVYECKLIGLSSVQVIGCTLFQLDLD